MAYERVNWENLPSKNTPVNADNLNKMDEGIDAKQDKMTAGTGIEITGENIINNLNANYSTEEQVIGKWIDGKPLYRKVIEMGNMANEDYKSKAHNIQNIKYARIVDVVMQRGTQSSSNFQVFSLGNVGGRYNDTLVGFDTYMDASNIYVYCATNRTAFVGTAIIEYTKTTD